MLPGDLDIAQERFAKYLAEETTGAEPITLLFSFSSCARAAATASVSLVRRKGKAQ